MCLGAEGRGGLGGTLRIKTTNQTKSNYFYYHIVLLQLYSEIFFRSKKQNTQKKNGRWFVFFVFSVFSPYLILHLSERKTSTDGVLVS